jgi:hypothetical protein
VDDRRGGYSLLFVPPGYREGERGLRIRLEGVGHEPALEFALKELRARGADREADDIASRLAALDPRTSRSPSFPSVLLTTLLAAWERGGREVVRRYALARVRAD